jgi:hypothetical protein
MRYVLPYIAIMKNAKPTLFTVREVAMRLTDSRRDEVIDFVMRQIKHWTNNKLIRTTGTMHSGRGRSRSYAKEELIAAAYLLRLSRYGLTIGQLESFRKMYDGHIRHEAGKADLYGKVDEHGNGAYIKYYGLGEMPGKGAGFILEPRGTLETDELWYLDTGDKMMNFTDVLVINCRAVVERLGLD